VPDRLVGGKDARDREEAGLHHRVDPVPHTCHAGDFVGVDHMQRDVLGDQLALYLGRQVVPHGRGRPGAVEQHRRASLGVLGDLHLLEQAELVASDEVGVVDEIGGPDRLRAEAQVRDRHRP
jgi:hypothetical protein